MDGRVVWSGRMEWLYQTGVFLSFSSVLSSSGFFLVGSFLMFSQWCDLPLCGRITMEGHFILFPIYCHATFQKGPSGHQK